MNEIPDTNGESAGSHQNGIDVSGHQVSCATVQENAHDYVMHSADESVVAAIENHCNDCPKCAAFVESLRRTATMLAFTVPLSMPSFSAKASLFSRIAQDQEQESPVVYAGDLQDLATPSLPVASVSNSAEPVPSSSRWSRLQAYALPLATVPLLLALGIVGAWGMSAHMDASDANDDVDLLNARVQLLRQELSDQGTDIASIDDVLQKPNSKQYSMYSSASNTRPSNANGIVLADPAGHKAVVFVWNLDVEIGMYDIVLDTSNGQSTVLDQIYVDNQGNSVKVVELGRPLSDCESIRIRPTYLGNQNDSQLLTDTSDVLYAPIIHGLNNVVDTVPGQPSGR